MKFLEDVGYDAPRHFDAHAYRTEDYAGVREFAKGCMRTYLILKEKAKRWNADAEIQAIVAAAHEAAQPAPSIAKDLGPRAGTPSSGRASTARSWPSAVSITSGWTS